MTEAGEGVQSKRRGGNRLDAVDSVVMTSPLKAALARNSQAREQFEQIPMSQKKQFLWWIGSAKREKMKSQRIEKTVELLAQKKSMSDYYYGRQKSSTTGSGE
jgi:uncharacterized protein YdeI (YjbR/CyaY-like superfamily)